MYCDLGLQMSLCFIKGGFFPLLFLELISGKEMGVEVTLFCALES